MISHIFQAGNVRGNSTQTTSQVPSQSSQEAALARGQERLSTLSDGQTIQGKILSVSQDGQGGRTAQVDIGGGAVINAKLSGNMALSAGQDISFSVKNGSDPGVTLRPLYANTAADSSVLKALSQAGLAASNDMTAMVREMMSEGMSIDRASLLGMTRGVNAFPGHASSVVQMTNLGIPLSPENIEQFENYKNYEHQVMGSIDSVMDDLPEAFRAMTDSGNAKGAMDMYGELLKLFSGSEEAVFTEGSVTAKPADGAAAGGEAAPAAPGGETAAAGQGQVTGAAAGGGAAVINAAMPEELPEQAAAGKPAGEAAAKAAADPAKALEEALRGHIGDENARSGASVSQTDNASNVLEAAMKAINEGQGAKTAVSPEFTHILRELDVPENIIRNLQTEGAGGSAQSELMRSLADAWSKTGHTSEKADNAWGKLFSSKEMSGILKNAVAKEWTLKPEDVENKENVRNLYDRLQSQTNRLAQILAETKAGGTHLAESVKNLQNNLDFMNDLNHMFQFVQLPLKMSGHNTHGDLYVYSNKKNAMHEDGTVSAILHLDMDNLGPVDVYVKMKDNNVKTNFYLADDEMIDLIMEHIDVLNSRLEKRGYNMDVKLHLQEDEMEEDVPVKQMLSGNLGKMSMLSHTSFDALA